MADGIRCYPGDGGPPIELTAGVRCPSTIGTFNMDTKGHTSNNEFLSYQFSITPYPGSSLVVIPSTPVFIGMNPNGSLVPAVVWIDSITSNSQSVTCTWKGNYNSSQWLGVVNMGNLHVSEIYPAMNQYGIHLTDSTNFLEINDAVAVGQCIWKGAVRADHTWTAPDIPGYDRSKYLIFAHWDNNSVVLDYNADAKSITAVYPDPRGISGYSSCDMEVAIFCDGVAPVPHNGGISIFNAAGQCTFSTSTAPFLLKGFIPAAGGGAPAGVRRMMVPLMRTGISVVDKESQWRHSYMGMRMSGNILSAVRGYYTGRQYPSNYVGVAGDKVINVTLPILDAANYL